MPDHDDGVIGHEHLISNKILLENTLQGAPPPMILSYDTRNDVGTSRRLTTTMLLYHSRIHNTRSISLLPPSYLSLHVEVRGYR